MNRAWPALFGALALAVPVGPAEDRILRVAVCGSPGDLVAIPIDQAPIDSHDWCREKLCHSGCERKRRQLLGH